MERYSEYKDSGVQWLGEIPRHWKTMRLGLLGECSNGVSKGGDYFGEGYPFVSYSDVYKNIELPHKVEGLANSTDEDRQRYSVEYGDVFFTRTSETIQEIGFSSTCLKTIPNAVFAGFLIRFRPTTSALIPEFSKYYFRCNNLRSFYVTRMNLVTRASLSQSLLRQLNVTIPPVEEQYSIVSYLDDKCGKIDKMLEGKQKQIELLAEMKQRIIADAVTHGLNPDVKMKATNNICLGEVPMHWDVMRYGTLFKLKPVKPHHGEELLSVFLNFGVIRAAESDKRTHAASEDLSKYQLVEPTDFVMNNQQAWRGSVGVSKLTGIISPAYHIFKMPNCFDSEYANYLLRSKAIVGQFEISSRGVGSIQRTLNFSWLNNRKIPVPPLSEQLDIVSFINEKVEKIDTLTSKLQQEIESIKEYKQRLISDVVTGQIKIL